jgi:pimeloyl-ACP methyl ester carboxylesterase
VDNREEPDNTILNDETREAVLRPLYNQAARFTELCNVYAPYYRQMTIGTYGAEGGYRSTEQFALAFSDVEEAFKQYLLENPNRRFVLMGHSQGSHMLIELLSRYFDNDAAMRSRLISALVIGSVGAVQVPAGQTVGGTFQNLPLCTHASDNACIVTYDSVASGGLASRTMPQQPLPCVNPTRLGGTPDVLTAMIYGTLSGIPLPTDVDSPWVAYPNLHTAECEADGFLAIGTLAEERQPLFSPQLIQLALGGNLHQADINYTIGDLLRVVSIQAGL